MSKYVIKSNNDSTERMIDSEDLSPKYHKLGIDIWIHFMNPGFECDITPRVKFWKPKDNKCQDMFSVEIETGTIFGDYSRYITDEQMDIILEFINLNKDYLLTFWNDNNICVDFLTELKYP